MLNDTDDYTEEELHSFRSMEYDTKETTFQLHTEYIARSQENSVKECFHKTLYFLFTPQEKYYMIGLYEKYFLTKKLSRAQFVNKCLEKFKGSVPKKKIVSFFKNYSNKHKVHYLNNQIKKYPNILDEPSIKDIHLNMCRKLNSNSFKLESTRKYLYSKKNSII